MEKKTNKASKKQKFKEQNDQNTQAQHSIDGAKPKLSKSPKNEDTPVPNTPPNDTKLPSHRFLIDVKLDAISIALFAIALFTRFYKLEEPRNIVFDELHYGKYVSLYMRRTFFFDSHPPLGKQLIAIAAYFANFDGKFKFDKIGSIYSENVPLFTLRLIPALCGSLITPLTYHFMLELGCKQWTAILASFILLCDNAMLTQSRFILMEPMLIFFSFLGLICILKYIKSLENRGFLYQWFLLTLAFTFLTVAICIKYAGWFSWLLGVILVWTQYWQRVLPNRLISNWKAFGTASIQFLIINGISVLLYLSVFYVHLNVLKKAGPHDSVMTSAFQASLEGGLASITKGQPLQVAHGSQITLRHTHGRTCWLHSHAHVYPLRYADKRGSSHQQQVTCYTFKDVNNWWIVKRPNKDTLVVNDPIDVIKHGDIIQLVHGITSRALNTHDVAAPMSPHNQEVSCYIDYNVSMPTQNLWRVEIINKDQTDNAWHSIQSMVRLVHVNSSQALKFSGRQLPDWGFFQHEIVTDKVIQQEDTVWNVEEHRYTKSEDEKERERDMVSAEMIPLRATSLSFWDKFYELQYKMFFNHQENVQNHMYSSDPIEWPLVGRGIAYWVSTEHNGQIHLLGNILVWYSGAVAVFLYSAIVVFYLLRRRRKCYDIDEETWQHFVKIGQILLFGYLLHYLPYFFVDRTLFLHHYLPALVFKCLLTAAVIEHISILLRKYHFVRIFYYLLVCCWVISVFWIFRKFCVLSYGIAPLSSLDVIKLRWKDSWDFIIHKQ
ncbi:protein O-mannosyltransferase 1 [Planococcus citri]|uniref:protein O-mannosyltransferase 1 n=1 Tax=Planococcus citri TaxID=170843 RepID=UPI0031F7EFC9